MENKKYYVAVNYALYTGEGEERELVEETTANNPYIFISGINMTLERFEEQILACNANDTFDITLTPEEAYGEYDDENVADLDRSIFEVDGKLDTEHVQEGKIVPLMTADGQRISAVVTKIGDSKVTVDFNHPLAGEKLQFVGKVLVKHEASAEEIAALLQPKCGGGCHGCGGGSCGEGGCNCEGGCDNCQ